MEPHVIPPPLARKNWLKLIFSMVKGQYRCLYPILNSSQIQRWFLGQNILSFSPALPYISWFTSAHQPWRNRNTRSLWRHNLWTCAIERIKNLAFARKREMSLFSHIKTQYDKDDLSILGMSRQDNQYIFDIREYQWPTSRLWCRYITKKWKKLFWNICRKLEATQAITSNF